MNEPFVFGLVMSKTLKLMGILFALPVVVFILVCVYYSQYVTDNFFNSWTFVGFILALLYSELAMLGVAVLYFLTCQKKLHQSVWGIGAVLILISYVLFSVYVTSGLAIALCSVGLLSHWHGRQTH